MHKKGNNCYPVSYMGDITQDIPRDKRHSLDHYVLTENIANFARLYKTGGTESLNI